MATLFVRVKPGDLITASDMNAVQTRIEALETLVASLQGTVAPPGTVVINGTIPISGVVKVGAELQILGQNFGVSTGAHRAFVDDVQVSTFKAGINDQFLRFDVPPPLVPLLASGRPATLSVSNSISTAQRQIFLESSVTPAGPVDVEFLNVNPLTILKNVPATFQFRLRNRANSAATLTIAPLVTIAVNPSLWNGRLKVLDNNLAEVFSRTISINTNEEKLFHVRIDPVPDVPDNTPFQLTVSAASGAITGTSGAMPFAVAQASEQPDPTISVSFEAATLQPGGTPLPIVANTIQLASGTGALVTLLARFEQPGTYTATVTVQAPATNWLTAVNTPPMVITAAELAAAPSGKVSRFPEFAVSPTATATDGGIVFQIQRTLPASALTKKLPMVLDKNP